jgi:uncharacterized membrane protein YhaH (DUF805 family)
MNALVFSPGGRTNRVNYLSTFLIWSLGTVFVVLVAGDLTARFSLALSFFAVAGATAVLAWMQVCATIRRLQDLSWSWLLALPWIPISLWPVWRSFSFPIPAWLPVLFALYGAATGCVLLGRRGIPLLSRPAADPPRARPAPLPPRPVAIQTPPPVPVPALPAAIQLPPPARAWSHPLVGWLVITDGADRGKEFRLHARTSQASSGSAMEVAVAGGQGEVLDSTSIRYDPRSNQYSISSASGSARLNGSALTNSSSLSAYDRLQIGRNSFIFVPLCGVYHQWTYADSQGGAAAHE